jgi:WD40 repeat protein
MLADYTEEVRGVAFSPAATTLAVRSKNALTLWSLSNSGFRRSFSVRAESAPFCFAPDGQRLAYAERSTIRVIDLEHRSELAARAPTALARPVVFAFTCDGRQVAVYDSDDHLRLWQPAGGPDQDCGKLPHDPNVHVLAVPNTKMLVLTSGATVRFWDDAAQVWHADESVFPTPILAVAASPNGRLLALGGYNGYFQLWDTPTGRKLGELLGHEDEVYSIAFAPDGRTLASSGLDGTVRLWHVATRQELFTLETRPKRIWSVAFSADGRMLATAGEPAEDGRSVCLWYAADEPN